MLTRRRFLAIAASAAALPGLPGAGGTTGRAQAAAAPVVWRGVAMGALASITLARPDPAAARRCIARCLAEVDRLESIFSLYRPDSALSRLNQQGFLDSPPQELLEVLSFSLGLAEATDGAFDPTIQPLFRVYLDHFGATPTPTAPPAPDRIAEALALVDYRLVELDQTRIRLSRDGMAVSLNGVAQGYVTDRIAALLRAEGFNDVLLDLGELRGAGRHPDGRPWRAAVADPAGEGDSIVTVELAEERPALPALATSAGHSTVFDPTGRWHHLLNPRTGSSARQYASVTVAANEAMVADGLSTALSIVPATEAKRLLDSYRPTRAWLLKSDGTLMQHSA